MPKCVHCMQSPTKARPTQIGSMDRPYLVSALKMFNGVHPAFNDYIPIESIHLPSSFIVVAASLWVHGLFIGNENRRTVCVLRVSTPYLLDGANIVPGPWQSFGESSANGS